MGYPRKLSPFREEQIRPILQRMYQMSEGSSLHLGELPGSSVGIRYWIYSALQIEGKQGFFRIRLKGPRDLLIVRNCRVGILLPSGEPADEQQAELLNKLLLLDDSGDVERLLRQRIKDQRLSDDQAMQMYTDWILRKERRNA